jgi:hypothetical protein
MTGEDLDPVGEGQPPDRSRERVGQLGPGGGSFVFPFHNEAERLQHLDRVVELPPIGEQIEVAALALLVPSV